MWFRTGQDGRGRERVLADNTNTVIEEDMSQSIMSKVSSSLVVQVVNSSHGGLYECVAENNLGSVSIDVTVYIYALPQITRPLTNLVVHAGSLGVLRCAVRAIPAPTIVWYRNGMEISNRTFLNVFIVENAVPDFTVESVLNIESIAANLEGNFTCIASNSFGEERTTSLLTVLTEEVMILNVTTNTTALITSSVTLSCMASGVPVPNIVWYRNGSVLDPNSASITSSNTIVISTLQLDNPQLTDAGFYTCNASSNGEFDSRDFTLSFNRPAAIVAYPSNSEVPSGNSSSFTCIGSGIPAPTIRWNRGDDVLPQDAFNISTSVFTNSSSHFTVSVLTLCSLEILDSNIYSCTAFNNIIVGYTQDSANFSLEVQESPTFINSPMNTTVEEFDTLQLSCVVVGLPRPQISWWRTGQDGRQQQLTMGSNIIIEAMPQNITGRTASRLTINSVNSSLHEGRYQCMASNSLGDDSTAQATVTIYVPATILTYNTDRVLNISDNVILQCTAVGYPLPTISWMKDGVVITEIEGEVNITENSIPPRWVVSLLEICDVSLASAGTYECKANNSLVVDQTTFRRESRNSSQIIVLDGPMLTQHPHPTSLVVAAGAAFSLNCTATGFPVPVISWYLNNSIISGNGTVSMSSNPNSYTVFSVVSTSSTSLHHAGDYHCEATQRDQQGRLQTDSSNSTTLIFTSPPQLIEAPQDYALFKVENVIFTCKFQSLPEANVAWTYLSQSGESTQLTNSEKYSLSFDVTNGQDYIYIATNLTVMSAVASDAGQYVCNSTNNVPNFIVAVSYGTGQIFVPESNFGIVKSPRSVDIVVGNMVTLQCEFAAAVLSGLTIYWTKNGKNFTLEGSSQQLGAGLITYNLEFTAKSADSGSYQCIGASTFYNQIIMSDVVVLQVFVPVSIKSIQPNTTVTVGDTVNVFCLVEGTHEPTVLWTTPTGSMESTQRSVNNTLTQFTLVLSGVTLDNTGTYSCAANNMYADLPPGSDQQSFYLYVQSQPRIDPLFMKTDVEIGRHTLNLMFNILEAAPVVSEQNTFLNFTRYDGNNSEIDYIFGVNSMNWSLTNVGFDNEGNYSSETSNIVGISTGTIHLDVKSPPVQFTLVPDGGLYYDPSRSAYIVVEGASLVFNCSFHADPEPSVIWKHNDISIMASTRHVQNNDFSNTPPIGRAQHILTIHNVVQEDSGNYSCNGTNNYGTHQVSETVMIIVPPTVTAIDEEVIGVETRDNSSSSIVLGFTITRAIPEVLLKDIVWTYAPNNMNSELINITDIYSKLNFTEDMRRVTVKDLQLSDAGTFTLTATNEAGNHTASVKLIIHVEPELIDMDYSRNETVEKTMMSFWCFADGVPQPTIVWLHNESLILVDTSPRHMLTIATVESDNRGHIPMGIKSTLTITGVRLRDAGEYLCRVDPYNIDKGRQDVPDPFVVVVYPEPIDYCVSKPCQNGGTCSNVTNGYLCNCDPRKWKGVNCTIEIFDFDEPSIEMNPMFDDFPPLFTTTQVVCQVSGTPQPNITWYKDGKLLPNQRSPTLILEEVSLADRGRYHCVAENYDPNENSDPKERKLFTDISEDTVLNIEGIVQYKAELNIQTGSKRRKRQAMDMDNKIIIDEVASRLSGVRLPQYNATVYSVTEDSLSTAGPDSVDVIITLLAPQGNANLRNTLSDRLQQIVPEVSQEINREIIPGNISRFDGCEAEDTILEPLEPGGLSITISWPESDLGERLVLQCPCGNLSAVSGGQDISNAKANRMCGGNFTHGGEWETPFVSPCNFSSTTRRLCLVANLIDEPEEAISTLDNITSDEDNIGSTEIGVTTILLEALQTNVVANNQSQNLTRGFLTVVDNLLDADPEQIQMSQEASNSSARILDVVESVSESIPFPENETEVIIPLTSFAVAVQEVNPSNFEGQVFSAGLGADFNFNNDKPIDPTALSIGQSQMSTGVQTASLSIPPTIFKNENATSTRITNSIFLNDALFSRRNTSATIGFEVGSIILAAALSNGRTIENLKPPIMLTFLKKPSVENGTNTNCTFWDFSANDGFGDWSNRGCIVANETDTSVTCECSHLTNFAILLDPNPPIVMDDETPPPPFVATLSAISYIGAVVSILSLISTIITYLSSKKLRVSEAGQLLINLCVAMLGLYIMYILSLQAVKDRYACAVAGGLLHYFMLASFLAMAAEAVSLYTKLVLVLGVPLIIKNKYVLKTCLIVWILPFIIVVASEAPNWNNYVSEVFCRPFNAAFYGGLMTPFIIIYLFNWIIFATIFWSLLRKKASKADKSKAMKLKQNFIIAVTLSLLFGLGWGVGLVATTSIPVREISYTLQTLFVLLTSFQGLWIFIMNCIRSEEARKQWKSWVYIITCRKVSLETKKSITGHVSSGYDKGTHGKHNKYSTLSTAQTSGSQTMQRILKKELNSSIISSDIIDNDNSVFNPTLDPVGEEKKVDLSSDALTVPTSDIHASNPFIPIDDDDIHANHSAMNIYASEMEMKESKLETLTVELEGKLKSETNSLHSVKIMGDTASEHGDSKSVRSERIDNEFDILWVRRNEHANSRSSLQVENRKSVHSDQGMIPPHTDPVLTSSHTELRTTSLAEPPIVSYVELPATSLAEHTSASHSEIPIASSTTSPTSEDSSSPELAHGNESIPLIDYGASSNVDVIVPIPDEIKL